MLQIYDEFINKDLVQVLSPGTYYTGGQYLPLVYVKFKGEPDRREIRSPDDKQGVSFKAAMQIAVDDIAHAIRNPL